MGIMGVVGPVVWSLGTLVPLAVADTWWTSDLAYTYLKTSTSQDDVAANNGVVEFDGHLIVTGWQGYDGITYEPDAFNGLLIKISEPITAPSTWNYADQTRFAWDVEPKSRTSWKRSHMQAISKTSSYVIIVGFTYGDMEDFGTNLGAPTIFHTQDFSDAVIMAYDTTGTLQWGRQVGTTSNDHFAAVSVGPSNEIYAAGATGGNVSGKIGYDDIIIYKYYQDGSLAGTYQFGTDQNDYAYSLAHAGSDFYLCGTTEGAWPTKSNAGSSDVLVIRFNSAFTEVWSAQRGSSAADDCSAVAVNHNSGEVFVTGNTYGSIDGQNHHGGKDFFIMKFDASGNWKWTRQHGSSGDESIHGLLVSIAVNPYRVLVAGTATFSFDGAATLGSGDAFVVEYTDEANSASPTYVSTTFIGSDRIDQGKGLIERSSGDIYVVGGTEFDPQDTNSYGELDAFVQLLNTPTTTETSTTMTQTSQTLTSSSATSVTDTSSTATDTSVTTSTSSTLSSITQTSSTGTSSTQATSTKTTSTTTSLTSTSATASSSSSTTSTITSTTSSTSSSSSTTTSLTTTSSTSATATSSSTVSTTTSTQRTSTQVTTTASTTQTSSETVTPSTTTSTQVTTTASTTQTSSETVTSSTTTSTQVTTTASTTQTSSETVTSSTTTGTQTVTSSTTTSTQVSSTTSTSSWTTTSVTSGRPASEVSKAVEFMESKQAELARELLSANVTGPVIQDLDGNSMVSFAFKVTEDDEVFHYEGISNISVHLPAASLQPLLGEVVVLSMVRVTAGSMLASWIDLFSKAAGDFHLTEPVNLQILVPGQQLASVPLQLSTPIRNSGDELARKACVAWDESVNAWKFLIMALNAPDNSSVTCSVRLSTTQNVAARRLVASEQQPSLFGVFESNSSSDDDNDGHAPGPEEQVPWATIMSLVAAFVVVIAVLAFLIRWKLSKTGTGRTEIDGSCSAQERAESQTPTPEQAAWRATPARVAMISARFNEKNHETEMRFRRVRAVLKRRKLDILMVEAGSGEDFGIKTIVYLQRLKDFNGVMLAVCTPDYGEVTASPYSTNAELKFALDNNIEVLPLRVSDTYPPQPPSGPEHAYDKECFGRGLVRMTMPDSKVYVDCRNKTDKEVADAIEAVLRPPKREEGSSHSEDGGSGHLEDPSARSDQDVSGQQHSESTKDTM